MQPYLLLLLVKKTNYTLLFSIRNMLLGGGSRLVVLSQKKRHPTEAPMQMNVKHFCHKCPVSSAQSMVVCLGGECKQKTPRV